MVLEQNFYSWSGLQSLLQFFLIIVMMFLQMAHGPFILLWNFTHPILLNFWKTLLAITWFYKFVMTLLVEGLYAHYVFKFYTAN